MRIYAAAPSTMPVATWIRRYATMLIIIGLVSLATIGAGVARALYEQNARPATHSAASLNMNAMLDQHDRHPAIH